MSEDKEKKRETKFTGTIGGAASTDYGTQEKIRNGAPKKKGK